MTLSNMKKPLIIALSVIVAAILIFLVFFTFPSNYKNTIRVRETSISTNQEGQPIRIGIFADTMIGFDYQVENLDLLVQTVNDSNVDVLIFNGGLLYNEEISSDDRSKIEEAFNSMRARFGKFAIPSDTDSQLSDEILFNGGFELLENTNRPLIINQRNIVISGLLTQNFTNPLADLNEDNVNVAFTHTPENNAQIRAFNVNAIVSAKGFGGQYVFPLFGSVYEDLRALPYYRGVTRYDDITIIANNGIGINRGSMRFNAPSTLDILTIN